MAQPSLIATIIVPMRNEENYIGKCLDSILGNAFPPDQLEIIVVDGESTDKSRELVEERAVRFPYIRLLSNKKRSVPPGLNMAILQARGRYIIRMDAHTEYPSNYISDCVEELERTRAEVVGGRCITEPRAHTTVARAVALVTQNPVCVGNSAFRIGNVGRYVDTVPFGAFRREIFDRIGLFREDLERHQDFELNARVRKAGGRIYLSSRIHCTYYNAPSFSKFMRQAYMNGIYMGRAWQRYPVSFCWRHAAPITFVCGMLLLALLGQFIPAFMWVLAAAAAVYILAITAAGLLIARRHGLRYLCLAPVLICSYHLVYGGSTCLGLLNEPFVRWWPFAATSKTRVTDCVQDSESSSS